MCFSHWFWLLTCQIYSGMLEALGAGQGCQWDEQDTGSITQVVQGFLPCVPAVSGLQLLSWLSWLLSWLGHTDRDGLSSTWARSSAAMSPWASDSAEFPPCRTQQRHISTPESPKGPQTFPPSQVTGSHHPKPPKPHQPSPAVPCPAPVPSDKITASVGNSSIIPNTALWPSRRNFHPLPAQPHPTHPHREAPFSGRS